MTTPPPFPSYVIEGGVAYQRLNDGDLIELGDMAVKPLTGELATVNRHLVGCIYSKETYWEFRRPLEPTPENYALLQSAWVAHFGVAVGTRVRIGDVPREAFGEDWSDSIEMSGKETDIEEIWRDGIQVGDGPLCTLVPFHVLSVLKESPAHPPEGEDDRETVGKCEGFGKEIKEGEVRNTWADEVVTCEKCSPPPGTLPPAVVEQGGEDVRVISTRCVRETVKEHVGRGTRWTDTQDISGMIITLTARNAELVAERNEINEENKHLTEVINRMAADLALFGQIREYIKPGKGIEIDDAVGGFMVGLTEHYGATTTRYEFGQTIEDALRTALHPAKNGGAQE